MGADKGRGMKEEIGELSAPPRKHTGGEKELHTFFA